MHCAIETGGFRVITTLDWSAQTLAEKWTAAAVIVPNVAKADGDALGLKPVYPVWMDVRPAAYPVFNVQRPYGGADGECTWPKEECAKFDPWGNEFVGQGRAGPQVERGTQRPRGRAILLQGDRVHR